MSCSIISPKVFKCFSVDFLRSSVLTCSKLKSTLNAVSSSKLKFANLVYNNLGLEEV